MKRRKTSSFDLYIFLILIAFEILMSFTFLGYIHIPPISVTFAYIPILVAACILGTVQSTVIGAVFGLASMYKACVSYAFSADMLFSPFMSGNPLGSVVLAFGTRTLFGLIAGLAFSAAKKRKNPQLYMRIVSALSPITHALLVLAAMDIFFKGSTAGYFQSRYLVLSNILSSLVCIAVTELTWRIYNKKILTVKTAIDHSRHIEYIDSGKKRTLVSLFTFFVLGMTVAAAWYFAERMLYVLDFYKISNSFTVRADIIHLQIQFMAAVFSLNIISITVLALGYQYTAYRNFLGEFDAVTNVMGRRIFINCCERAQKNFDPHICTEGWFLFFDIDNFKTINDTLGHTAGDNVLREVAFVLKNTFYNCGITGRMGGDEFAVMIDKKAISEEKMKKALDGFLREISDILGNGYKVSCSIGGCRFTFPADMTQLMDKTDLLLYEAKRNGRACYVLGSYTDEESSVGKNN